MNDLFSNPSSIIALVSLFISAVWGPSVVAKIQGKARISEVVTEGDKNAESMYVSNMNVILGEYKEQVSGFRTELVTVRLEFAEFKDSHNKEVIEYQEKIVVFEDKVRFLELQIVVKDEKIENLETKLLNKDTIVFAKERRYLDDIKQ